MLKLEDNYNYESIITESNVIMECLNDDKYKKEFNKMFSEFLQQKIEETDSKEKAKNYELILNECRNKSSLALNVLNYVVDAYKSIYKAFSK